MQEVLPGAGICITCILCIKCFFLEIQVWKRVVCKRWPQVFGKKWAGPLGPATQRTPGLGKRLDAHWKAKLAGRLGFSPQADLTRPQNHVPAPAAIVDFPLHQIFQVFLLVSCELFGVCDWLEWCDPLDCSDCQHCGSSRGGKIARGGPPARQSPPSLVSSQMGFLVPMYRYRGQLTPPVLRSHYVPCPHCSQGSVRSNSRSLRHLLTNGVIVCVCGGGLI